MGRGYQKGGYQEQRHKGKGKGKDRGKDQDDPRMQRDDSIERRYNAPPAATSINATAFILCLALYVHGTIEPMKDELQRLQCFVYFSKWLSWLLRHGRTLLHPTSLSLTLSELFHFPEFDKHTNHCLTYLTRHNERTGIFGNINSGEVRRICKDERVNYESMRYFIPLVTVTWFNDKGRVQLAVINQSPVREPYRNEWISTELTEADVDDFNRHNGSYATTNVFFRIQSGHSGLTAAQREELSPPYDFRHNTLMHKTTKHKWNQIKDPRGSKQVEPFGRDIHLVPTEFLYSDPEMLRNYGERILIFNMHDPATREAFSTARENTNGYVLVSEPVGIDLIEGVFDLDKCTWENFYTPRCRLDKVEEYGVNDAEKLCKYFSKVYQQRSCSFDDLEPSLRDSVIAIGQHYLQNLRYPTGGTPRFLKADTPADVQRSKEVRKDVIIEIVEDVADQIEQKKKIKAKAMPKPDPPDLPAKSDPAKLQAKTKPPPACATEPPPKAPPKGFESYASTDTTVKVKEEPKSSTDTTVKKHKAAPATDTTVKKESSNKISLTPRGTSSTPATSSASPIPPAGPPPEKVPKPPPYPPRKPERSAGQPHPTPPPAPIHREQPSRTREQRFPTPPPAPKRDHPRSSDTTEYEPLPRRRRETPSDDVEMRPSFSYDFDQDSNLEAYVEILTSLSDTVPDAYTARERRLSVWDRIMDLVTRGLSTGSRMLDRMLLHGRDTVLTSENIYFLPYVPTPEEHFYRQDPGEAGMLFRPSLMLHITDQEFSLEVLDALADLGRNVLAGRAVLRDHPLNMSTGVFNTTTYYLTMVVLNLGNMKRIPYFANGKRYPSRIRDVWAEMKPRLVLPHLVVNNPGHIITLCESFDFVEHHELCIEYNVIGIQVSSTKERHRSPSIAVFLKSPLGLVELLHHWDVDYRDQFWMIHAVLARCVFGPKTHDVHEGTRERTEHRYYGEPVSAFAFSEERYNTHGCINIVTSENDLDPVERYEDITTASYFETGGLPESFVERLGMSDVRVLTIHINSDAFRHSILRVRTTLRAIFAKALMAYTDFITGDFNLFANRQFKTDRGGSYIGGIVVEVLDDVVSAMNTHLSYYNKITYNISSSTPPQDVFDTVVEGSQSANLDCMLCISVFYNRQRYETERPERISDDLFLAPDYMHSVSERPRQLLGYDVCLRPSDKDWHIPLIVRTSAYSTRNRRTRGQDAQNLRNQKYRDYQNRSYQYQQQSRYHGSWQDHGSHPYARSSSSQGQHWDGWYGGWR